jgi:hypothetical protein
MSRLLMLSHATVTLIYIKRTSSISAVRNFRVFISPFLGSVGMEFYVHHSLLSVPASESKTSEYMPFLSALLAACRGRQTEEKDPFSYK